MGPLKLADKVAIMTNERGLLKLQFMVDLEAGDVQWIEFYVRSAAAHMPCTALPRCAHAEVGGRATDLHMCRRRPW